MRELELLLLKMWLEHDIKEIYKYKHRIKAFREPLVNMELFTDLSCGTMFADVEDLANHIHDSTPEEFKVSVEELIQRRTTTEG